LCSIDLNKAFDNVNYQALLIKLIKRKLPVALLDLLENWLKILSTILKWDHIFSYTFAIKFGVRQRSILSPLLLPIHAI